MKFILFIIALISSACAIYLGITLAHTERELQEQIQIVERLEKNASAR